MNRMLFKNISIMFSGDVEEPILDYNSLIVEDMKIKEIGNDLIVDACDTVVDLQGAAIMPGLIDSHAHPVLGEWTPRQSSLGWIDGYVKAGITGLVSAGETHIPGKPKDAKGCQALAILAYKTFKNARPSGMKVYGGALIMHADAKEEDFKELANMGMFNTGEIGLGSANNPETAGPMTDWGRKHGIKTLIHKGATYLPGTMSMDLNTILKIKPDVVCHITNGADTAQEINDFLEESHSMIEFTRPQLGNDICNKHFIKELKRRNEMKRILLGTDTPSGLGIYNHGLWEMICYFASLCDVSPETAICFSTGNIADFYGLNTGVLREGYCADLVVLDAPVGCAQKNARDCMLDGTIPGISLVLIDGQIMADRTNVNTAPARRDVIIA